MLGLLCRGERRFRVGERRQQSDGLNRAMVEWMPDAALTPLQPQFLPLAGVLRQAWRAWAACGRHLEPNYDDASWVSHRLAEFLPLEPPLQQRLLEIDDPNARLDMLAPLIETGPA